MKSLFRSLFLSAALFSVALITAPQQIQAAALTITAANVVPGPNAQKLYGIAGAAITAGQLVYLDVTTNTWKLSDCDSGTAAVRDVDGIAVTTSGNGAPLTIVTYDDALVIGATVTNGTIYVLGNAAGAIAPAADLTTGWYACVVAIGKSSTTIIFRVNPDLRTTTAL